MDEDRKKKLQEMVEKDVISSDTIHSSGSMHIGGNVKGNKIESSGSWSASTGHLVTMLIVTGPDGTFVHFWFMYPSFSSNVSPQTV